MTDPESDREHRLNAIEKNVDWLRKHDLDDETVEAAKRLGLIKGDVRWLIESLTEGQEADS